MVALKKIRTEAEGSFEIPFRCVIREEMAIFSAQLKHVLMSQWSFGTRCSGLYTSLQTVLYTIILQYA